MEFGSNLTVNGTITGMTNLFTKDEVNGQINKVVQELTLIAKCTVVTKQRAQWAGNLFQRRCDDAVNLLGFKPL